MPLPHLTLTRPRFYPRSVLVFRPCFYPRSVLVFRPCFYPRSVLVFRPCFYPRSVLVFRPCFYPRSVLVFRPCFYPRSVLVFRPCFSSLCPRVSPLLLSSLCPRVSPLLLSSLSALPSLLVFHPCVDSLSSLVSCPRSYSRILSVCLDLAFLVNLPVSGLRPSRAAEIGSCFSASQHSRLVACDLTSVLRSLRTRSRASYVRWRTLAQPRCGGLSLSRAVTDRGSWPRLLKGQLHGLPG